MTPTAAIEDPAIPAELCVLEGRLKGSRCGLQRGRATTVGAGPENDIVLAAADIGAGRLSLQVRNQAQVQVHVLVQVLAGEVIVDGRGWPAGAECIVALQTPIQLGRAVVAVMSVAPMAADSACHAGAACGALGDPVDGRHGWPAGLLNVGLSTRRGWLVAGATLSALSLGAMTAGSSAQEGTVDFRHVANRFESALHDAGFNDLRVQVVDGRALRVTGYLETAVQRASVASMLGQQGVPGRMDVWVNGALVAAVQEVFRVHHVATRAVPEGPGRVVVHTQEADTTRLQSIVSRAQRDVSGLRSLELRNVAPATATEPLNVTPIQPPNPGKRIAAIVPGESAYIVTADGSRYFEGAVMPSGLRITAIRPGDVQFERNAAATNPPF
jgi:type III secretion protein D